MFLGDVNNVELGSEFSRWHRAQIGPALKAAEKTLFIKLRTSNLLRFPSYPVKRHLDAVLFP